MKTEEKQNASSESPKQEGQKVTKKDQIISLYLSGITAVEDLAMITEVAAELRRVRAPGSGAAARLLRPVHDLRPSDERVLEILCQASSATRTKRPPGTASTSSTITIASSNWPAIVPDNTMPAHGVDDVRPGTVDEQGAGSRDLPSTGCWIACPRAMLGTGAVAPTNPRPVKPGVGALTATQAHASPRTHRLAALPAPRRLCAPSASRISSSAARTNAIFRSR